MFLAVIAARWPFVRLPFSADEAYYSVAARMWLEGLRLYADLGFVRPPGMAGVFALPRMTGFQAGDGFLRLLSAGFMGLTAAVLVWWMLRRLSVRAVAIAAACLVAWSASLSLQNEANAETWMLLPYAASALVGLSAFGRDTALRRAIWLSACAGLLVAVAALFKQVALVGLAVPFIAWVAYRPPARRGVLLTAVFLGAAVIGVLSVPAWVAVSGDGVRHYLYFVWLGVGGYIAGAKATSGPYVAQRVAMVTPSLLVPLGVAAASIGVIGWRRRDVPSDPLVVFALWWLAVSTIGVAASGRWYPHYFIQLLPAGAVLLAVSAQMLFDNAQGSRRAFVLAVAVVTCPVLLSASSLAADLDGLGRETGQRSRPVALAKRTEWKTRRGETALIWGPPMTAAYVKRDLWGGVPWLYYGMGTPASAVVLGGRVESQADRMLERLESEDPPDTVVLAAELSRPIPGAAVDDPRVARRLGRLLDEEYELVWRTKRSPQFGEVYRRR